MVASAATRGSMAASRGPQCDPKLVPQTPIRSGSTSGRSTRWSMHAFAARS